MTLNTYTLMTDTGTNKPRHYPAPTRSGGGSPSGSTWLTDNVNAMAAAAKNAVGNATDKALQSISEKDNNNGGGKGGGTNNRYSRYSYYSRGGGGGGGATAENPNNLAALAAALQAQKQARIDAINAANMALDQQAGVMKDKYNASLTTIGQDYQKLRNQAEVNRYRAQFNQREALANRGALDSGAGRQENMALSNNYNNNLNAINLQEANERANIQRAINEMYANVESQKAQNMTNGLSDYNSALQNLINAQYSGYTPEGSAYYQQALQALGANSGAENSNYLAYLRALGYNV